MARYRLSGLELAVHPSLRLSVPTYLALCVCPEVHSNSNEIIERWIRALIQECSA